MLSTKLKEAAGNGADATLYVNDVFSTYLYTGNGSTQTINNGIDLAGKGGLVWIKSRMTYDTSGNVTNHNLITNPAAGRLQSNTTAALGGYGGPGFTSTGFQVDGTVLNSLTSDGTPPNNYASWTFRKAAKFFDVVTYTGNGASNRDISHSLGIAPGMIIIKRTDSTSDWYVYNVGHPFPAEGGALNLTASFSNTYGALENVFPTASTFRPSQTHANINGASYVAYLFAHDTDAAGIIQCGSFTADASGNATVNLGWEPQYLMFKKTNVASDWATIDTMRGWNYQESRQLKPNLSDAENAPLYCTPNATGFATTTGGFDSNSTYIYMAIRRPNKPPTSGTQVFSPNAVATDTTGATTGFPVDLCFDALRGAFSKYVVSRLTGSNYLATNLQNAESTGASSDWSQSNTGINNNGIGLIGASAVYWNFKRAPGFFDVVCYTGTGSATTQAHNLAAVPELMIIKNRSVGNTSWPVYSKSLTVNQYLILNTALSYATFNLWNATAPTSSVFSVATYDYVNASGNTYVAYLFATLAGISKVGSYTGNGSTGQAIACGFSAGARFVLIKRTDATGDWYTFDSARGLTSGSSPYLLLNSTAAEITGNNGVYASAGGFTLATSAAGLNASGGTYIFLAVA